MCASCYGIVIGLLKGETCGGFSKISGKFAGNSASLYMYNDDTHCISYEVSFFRRHRSNMQSNFPTSGGGGIPKGSHYCRALSSIVHFAPACHATVSCFAPCSPSSQLGVAIFFRRLLRGLHRVHLASQEKNWRTFRDRMSSFSTRQFTLCQYSYRTRISISLRSSTEGVIRARCLHSTGSPGHHSTVSLHVENFTARDGLRSSALPLDC